MGLALFTTAGTSIALAADVPAVTSCLIGMTTGIGGGVLRDLLLRQVPIVLLREGTRWRSHAGSAEVTSGWRSAELELAGGDGAITVRRVPGLRATLGRC